MGNVNRNGVVEMTECDALKLKTMDEDDLQRCWEMTDPQWLHYHDHLWSPAVPESDERLLFEILSLCSQQSGLVRRTSAKPDVAHRKT